MIVQLNRGSIKGKVCESALTGKNYYGFYGIPYAKAPVGDLRFQVGEENLKPVMVFIHGGGYAFGSGSESIYGADFLINHDVVLVTINYRLHALGFLNLGIPECPGNAGLKDQVCALKWIKDNIRLFGGDDGNVTIFGESAGAASVNLHMISPLSKGLFNRGIIQSGNSLCPWSLNREPEKFAFLMGKELGYEGPEDAKELVEFLKAVDAREITMAVYNIGSTLEKDSLSVPWFMIPSVETIKEGAFIPEEPAVLIESAEPMPVIIGVDEKEFNTILYLKQYQRKDIEDAKRQLVPYLTRFFEDFKLDKNRFDEVFDKVVTFFFDNKTTESEISSSEVDLFSDLLFGATVYKSVKHVLHSSEPVYVYQFTFLGALNLLNLLKLGDNVEYASHSDELCYIFFSSAYIEDKEIVNKEPERTVIENMCRLWTNFAKTGNPNEGSDVSVEWSPSTVEEPTYLQIGSSLIKKEGRIDGDRVNFWDDIINSYST